MIKVLKTIFPMILAVLIITSCKKDEPNNPAAELTVDMEFQIEQTDFGSFKSTDSDVPQCSEFSMDYVVFEFNGTEYNSPLFTTMDGKTLTKAVKLPVLDNQGTYPLTKFVVYHDVLPVGAGEEDIIVRAAPEPNSKFHDLMTNKLNLDIEVEAFKKKEVTIDVLCFEDLFYEDFGFTWFEMNRVKIERQCFFGDVCTGKLADFDVDGSYYRLQSQGLLMDMPAVMKVKVYKKAGGEWGSPTRVFDNIMFEDGTGWYGEGACMEVYWANDEDKVEDFKFELYVQLPSGVGMDWILIDVFKFQDENGPESGSDGVVDFVVGNCQIDEADYKYPAWMDLPTDPFTMLVGGVVGPGNNGTYFDVTLSGIGSGHDISNGVTGVWCGDMDHSISTGVTYTTEAISSLMPLPANFTLSKTQLNHLNYLFNYLPTHYSGLDLFDFQTYTANNPMKWEEIQHAIWAITNNYDVTGEGMAETVYNEAITNGANYEVLPGQWAAIMFWIDPNVQVLFVMVDP